MVHFFNPVSVHLRGSFPKVAEALKGRSTIILTTPGSVKRGTIDKLAHAVGRDSVKAVVSDIPENPTVASMTDAARQVKDVKAQSIIAVGGGSVLDTAKGVAALRSPNTKLEWLSSHLRNNAPFPSPFAPPPIIAIPTTSGTGSEVTPWGTVWDEVDGKKYSLSHLQLYPESAVIMHELTLTCPKSLTVSTGLDALSHSMESLWNKHANAVSISFATRAIAQASQALPRLVKDPNDVEARRDMADASMLAGLSISVTKTALAHSISYPLTSEFGIPHGLACGFTLPTLLEFNGRTVAKELDPIVKALGARNLSHAVDVLDQIFDMANVGALMQEYVPSEAKLNSLKGELINPARAGNNLVSVTDDMARKLMTQAYLRHLKPAAKAANA